MNRCRVARESAAVLLLLSPLAALAHLGGDGGAHHEVLSRVLDHVMDPDPWALAGAGLVGAVGLVAWLLRDRSR